MNFVQANQVKPRETFAVLLYGPTGIGKTTTALSAPAPCAHVDFDGGITRVDASFTRHALIAQVTAWEGWPTMVADLANVPSKTIVIDTVGKMLDFVQLWVMSLPKYAAKRLDKPTLQVYGDIKVEFTNFVRGLKASGKNLVFIAQEVETSVKNRKGEDIRYHQPACGSDKNRTEILQDLDLVGYMYKDGDATRITFDPNESYYGKNTCHLAETIDVPRAEDFSGNLLLSQIHQHFINQQKENLDRSDYYAQVEKMVAMAGRVDSAEKANQFVEYAKTVDWRLDAKAKTMDAFEKRTSDLGLTYNKKSKKYE